MVKELCSTCHVRPATLNIGLEKSYTQIISANVGWYGKICLYKNEKGVEDFFYVSGGRGCHLCYFGDYPDVSFL